MKFHGKYRRTYLLAGTVLIGMVSGCASWGKNLDQTAATLPAPTVLSIVTATSTPLPSVENTSTPTPEPTPERLLGQNCIPVEENLPEGLISGVWVRGNKQPYLEPAGNRIPLKGGGNFSTGKRDMAVSPDGKYLAYIDAYLDATGQGTKSRILRIIDASGQPVSLNNWLVDWQWLIGWKDHQHLALLTANQELFLLEPFAGTWEQLPQPAWLGNLDVIRFAYQDEWPYYYSPSLNSILVRSGNNLELRDFQTGRTLYQAQGDLQSVNWSADGSTLVIGLYKLLNVIPVHGGQVLSVDLRMLDIDAVLFPTLSPDGQQLIFSGLNSGKLFLLDVEQREVRALCNDEFNYWGPAVWSPDHRFVIQEVDKSDSGEFDLLIDTQQMRAYKLVSGSKHRQAWLTAP